MPFTFSPCVLEDGTVIAGLYEVRPRVFTDERGYFFECYSQRDFAAVGIRAEFVFDYYSMSTKGVIRGLHFQKEHPQGKLITAIEGDVFDVALDMRRDSATFGRWYSVMLNSGEHTQFYIPVGFAHGFLALSEKAVLAYKCTDFYHPEDEGGIIWNDPGVGILWPDVGVDYLLSERDKKWLPLNR